MGLSEALSLSCCGLIFFASVIIIGGILNASTEEYSTGEIQVRESVFHDVKKKMQKNED